MGSPWKFQGEVIAERKQNFTGKQDLQPSIQKILVPASWEVWTKGSGQILPLAFVIARLTIARLTVSHLKSCELRGRE